MVGGYEEQRAPMKEKEAVAAGSVANIWNPPASKVLAVGSRVQPASGVYTISGLLSSTSTPRCATTRTSQSPRKSRDLGESIWGPSVVGWRQR